MLGWVRGKTLGLALGAIATLPMAAVGAEELKVSRASESEPYLPTTLALLALPPLGEATPFLPALERKIVLRLRERRVFLYEGDQVLASYPVAVGKPGWETPQGNFRVLHKVVNPQWRNPFTGVLVPPGGRNPLGDRLIVFAPMGNNNYAGFHGTTNESLIGQAVSHGCVRMRNDDIRALFEKIEVGTRVIVQP
ncbi:MULTISPECIES: L,D-transpeptidase [unclassified Thermosynechococcus]|uniref:L,D-transpeptidase n=1 Tax=unclassified Thermosynechococcus TaxID=2622553 RepID=UPI0028736AEF|nr:MULTISPECIES: L,D-transpeptidase [unclassified Thermosynechococcus]WNC21880.1 L,D-transpeptidase [Thermosynechococcus sp. PP22]WNC32120.1 L,D-transpeptidase [Thermosynechococcus sp. PKX95]WNC34648.1 L,D-transpeptidase [Thermosynechococcus sp. PKX91]WNC37165.1 L,D-transpeptidase [Thermosynechococcus sp. WL11]WNC39687.1 L,D-transpeptidase [Thermosynechococcus sp. WL17]